MDDPKAQTLEALEEFIAAQRSLLARTQEDIERLRALKGDVVRDPEEFFDNLGEKLDSPSFRLSDNGDAYNLSFSKKIQWGAFSGHDPTPLQTLPTPPTHPRSPLKTQRTPLSPLQLLVKSARQSIVDPVFVRFPPPPTSLPLSSSQLNTKDELSGLSGLGSLPVNAETARRNREHEKIRELKKMVRFGGKGGKGRGGGLSLPKQRQQAVFVREDVEDESLVEVDISMDVDDGGEGDDGSVTPTPRWAPNGSVKTEWVEPENLGAPPPATQKKKAKAKTKPPPAPRTTARRSTRKDTLLVSTSASSLPNTPPTATASTSRPNKRTKLKHEYTDSEDDDEYTPAPSTSYAPHPPPPPLSSSSSTPPPQQYGGKSLAALSRSTPSVGGKSLDAMGLGDTSASTSKSTNGRGPMVKTATKRGNGKERAKDGIGKGTKATGTEGNPTGNGTGTGAGKKGKEKVRPETYKQAWSVEEQHLLEQLLEEIPEGSGFRWQKISRAMGGRRTPRQVASRVQKYFEKLKRFGVG